MLFFFLGRFQADTKVDHMGKKARYDRLKEFVFVFIILEKKHGSETCRTLHLIPELPCFNLVDRINWDILFLHSY